MNKSWKLISKILNGEKKIESRWYKNKIAPWDRINSGDIVFFKNSSEAVIARAEVEKVLQFSDMNEEKVEEILNYHGHDLGIGKNQLSIFKDNFNLKKYCILIFLKNPRSIEPFQINKLGFGNACAWICVDDIENIKINY